MRKKLLKIFNGLFLIGFVILYSSCANTITSEISKIVIIMDSENMEGENYRHIHEVFAFSKKTRKVTDPGVNDLFSSSTVKASDDGHYRERTADLVLDGSAETADADLYTTPEKMVDGEKYTVTLILNKPTKIATFIIWGKKNDRVVEDGYGLIEDGPAGYVVTFYSGSEKVKTVKIPLDLGDDVNAYTIHL